MDSACRRQLLHSKFCAERRFRVFRKVFVEQGKRWAPEEARNVETAQTPRNSSSFALNLSPEECSQTCALCRLGTFRANAAVAWKRICIRKCMTSKVWADGSTAGCIRRLLPHPLDSGLLQPSAAVCIRKMRIRRIRQAAADRLSADSSRFFFFSSYSRRRR